MGAILSLIGEGASDLAALFSGETGGRVRDLGGAVEIETQESLDALRGWLAGVTVPAGIDANVLPGGGREVRLLLADMDSTIIGQECLDELADAAGHGPAVAAVTEAAMRGELDFEEALRARVKTLAGLPLAALEQVLAERITLTPGARVLTRTLRARGVRCVLVSGGFTQFTDAVAGRAGFDAAFGNTLGVEGGTLSGRVVDPILGREAKRERLEAELAELGAAPDDAICVGDGANDLSMLTAVPLGVAFRAKPVVAEAAPLRLVHADLRGLLYLLGIPRDQWADA
ncbi:phosphoserine phosphatase SerB [Parvularcula oceani]|uniref:phosphoserine phosphatase SerB n=1 Tax=Parvularcula oceani TaxID=1247963 RepID=UPI000564716F|nr:phosphoserine phosphatase SerB [Parvularcula oceani]